MPLLADPEHILLEALGIWGEKEWEGKKYMGATRTTVLVGTGGNIEKVWENVQFKEHAAEVLAYCSALG